MLIIDVAAAATGGDSFNRPNGTDLTTSCGAGDDCRWTEWGTGQDGLQIGSNTLLCDRSDNNGYCNATFGLPASSLDQQCSFQPIPNSTNSAQACCVRVPTSGSGYFLCLDARLPTNAAIHIVYRNGATDTLVGANGFSATGMTAGKYAVLRVEGPANAAQVRVYFADGPDLLGTPAHVGTYGSASTPLSSSLYGGVRLRDNSYVGQMDNFRFGDIAPPSTLSGLDARPVNTTCIAPAGGTASDSGVTLAPALGGVALSTPTAAEQSPLDPDVWYVAELTGRLKRVDTDTGASTTALDLGSQISLGGEGGLLGVALHPAFAQNGRLYAYFTRPGGSGGALRSVLSAFTSTDGGLTFPLASERVLLDLPQTAYIHLGGSVHFGPDGKLYLALGDGGNSSTSQNLSELRGKMLRLDVDAGSPYAVPGDNPFVGVPGARGEIWALGFRNPFRWSFDAVTGALWLTDVGEVSWEEINIVTRGANYGWPNREGAHCRISGACDTPGYVDPVVEYSHSEGCAVIGGFVSRSANLPGLDGAFVYGDLCTRTLWAAVPDGGGYSSQVLDPGLSQSFYGFAQDRDGETLILFGDSAAQIVPEASTGGDVFPLHLADTGCVDEGDPRRPAAGLVPYDMVAPFWSDGATKERWLALPEGTTISLAPDGDFQLPPGSVTMKQFRIDGRLIETRFFVRHGDGTWGAYTYEWNDAETDALLLSSAKQRQVNGKTWSYPSQAQCFQCHTEAAGFSLGLEVAQLNRDLFYSQTARTANQLSTLSAIGLFAPPLPEPIGAQPRFEKDTLDHRARAWLHENCAGCHRPGGPTPSSMDLRYTTSLSGMRVCDVAPALGDLGIADARLLRPGDPGRSLLSVRSHLVGPGQMPPLARNLVDETGTATLDAWIRSFASCSGPDSDGDGLIDTADNCPASPNANQLDSDGDGIGNACEGPCKDGVDNDGDGAVDYPHDNGCATAAAASESPACSDRVDNDGDGKVDLDDISCAGSAASTEVTDCTDRVDNDGDGGVDWDGAGTGAPDAFCRELPTRSSESPGCGLGAELILVFAVLGAMRQRLARLAR